MPSACSTKGVWDVIMDTLGIEPRAFRMRSGCDTTTPCARHSQLACAVAHGASRQLQVMHPWGGGFPPKTAVVHAGPPRHHTTTSPGHTRTHWTLPEVSWAPPGTSWIPFGMSWAPLDTWGHIQNTSRNVQVKMHHLQVMPLGSCRHGKGDPWRKLGCVASGWLRAVGPAAGVASWEASAKHCILGSFPPSYRRCSLGGFPSTCR